MKNKKQHPKISLIILIILTFLSCKKADIYAPDNLKVNYKEKIENFIDSMKTNDPINAEKIGQLQMNLNYESIFEEKAINKEKLLIIQISNDYKNQSKSSLNTKMNLLVFVNLDGRIRKTLIVSHTPENMQSKKQEIKSNFYNLLYTGKGIADGKYVICNLAGYTLYEVKYIDGLMRQQGLVRKKSESKTSKSQNEMSVLPISKSAATQETMKQNQQQTTLYNCYELYLETTYYDQYGNVTSIVEQSLGIRCSYNYYQEPPSDGNGTGGSPGNNELVSEFSIYTNRFIDVKAPGAGDDAPAVRGSIDFFGELGHFKSVAIYVSIPTGGAYSNWAYNETNKNASYSNSSSPTASVSFIGTLKKIIPSEDYPISASRNYTYAQAFGQ